MKAIRVRLVLTSTLALPKRDELTIAESKSRKIERPGSIEASYFTIQVLGELSADASLLARVNHVKIDFECGRLESKASH